mgnify:CR=1 FL=1
MHYYLENETDTVFEFNTLEIIKSIVDEVLDMEGCDYEAQVNVILTDNEGIKAVNKECRDIDRETDVLSFPNLEFEVPGFADMDDCFDPSVIDPETEELVLGDIMISVDKVKEQAENYGHSQKREFAFLVAHSMLHLSGYDHMTPEEAKVMEEKQEAVLQKLNITRD